MTGRWEVRKTALFASCSWWGFENYEVARQWVEDQTGLEILWLSSCDMLFGRHTTTGEEIYPYWIISEQKQTTLSDGEERDTSWDDRI